MSHFRTRDFFIAWLKVTFVSHKIVIFSSSTPCFMRNRCCSRLAWPLLHTPQALQILHPHCSLHMEMTTATIHITMRLSAHWLNRKYPQVMSQTISLKWTVQRAHRCSSTDWAWHRLLIQLRALRPPLLNRIWMMSNYGICWLSPLYLQDRGKCRPITSLSLLQWKLSVKFISLPNRCRETCSSVLTQKKVESRVTFRERRNILGTSSSSRRKWSSMQTPWIGKCCETSPWRTKRSSTRRSKIGSIETRM